MTKFIELKRRYLGALKHERHNNLGEITYWLRQYKDLARDLLNFAELTERWEDISTAPKDGSIILTVVQNSKSVIETRWLSQGPWVQSTPNGRGYNRPPGWYWSSWLDPVGPVNPIKWRHLPPAPEEKMS